MTSPKSIILVTTSSISIGLLFIITTSVVYSCNDIICGSVVSKCMLTQSCKCDLKNCSCCKECLNCLGSLYHDCCSCVDLCPKPNETKNILSKQSRVDEFEGGIPDLFNALTSVPEEEKWNIVSFPIDLNKIIGGSNFDYKYYMKSNHLEDETSSIINEENNNNHHHQHHHHHGILNCTVVYLTQCLSWNKCKQNCESMGASSYRWFHDGCCECVGSTCINFGINESKCTNCPESDDDDDDMNLDDLYDEDLHDYGDGFGPLDDISNSNL